MFSIARECGTNVTNEKSFQKSMFIAVATMANCFLMITGSLGRDF